MHRRTTAISLAALLLLIGFAADSQAARGRQAPQNTAIVGIVSAGGRTVLTNMAAGTPADRPPRTASGASIPAYRGLINTISRSHGVDPRLTEAVIEVESAFDPNAISTKGALGLMQLIPATGERFGVNNFFDPADNISGGVRFLRFLIDKFEGNPDLVLAAYNSGENRVERLGRVPAIPETEEYVVKVRQVWERLGGSSVIEAGLRSAEVAGARGPDSAIYATVGTDGILKLSNIGAGR